MTMDLSRIWDSEPNQPLKWLEWAPETPIRGPEGPKVASKVLNMWGFRVESVFGASKNRKTENAQNEILDVQF